MHFLLGGGADSQRELGRRGGEGWGGEQKLVDLEVAGRPREEEVDNLVRSGGVVKTHSPRTMEGDWAFAALGAHWEHVRTFF